jgi:hypothetical protein
VSPRECTEPGCRTRLSKYNDTDRCGQHARRPQRTTPSSRPRAPRRPPSRPPALEPQWPPAKEQAPCCTEKVDDLGRYPIGFCGPDCLRRKPVWRRWFENNQGAVHATNR